MYCTMLPRKDWEQTELENKYLMIEKGLTHKDDGRTQQHWEAA